MDFSQLSQLSGAYLFGGILFGAIGSAAFMYGKRTQSFNIMAISAVMLAYPFFVTGTWDLYLVGTALTVALIYFRD